MVTHSALGILSKSHLDEEEDDGTDEDSSAAALDDEDDPRLLISRSNLPGFASCVAASGILCVTWLSRETNFQPGSMPQVARVEVRTWCEKWLWWWVGVDGAELWGTRDKVSISHGMSSTTFFLHEIPVRGCGDDRCRPLRRPRESCGGGDDDARLWKSW